jgi:hypothetical protein
VENVAATGTDGAALAVHKAAKNRWTIATDGAETIVVTYRDTVVKCPFEPTGSNRGCANQQGTHLSHARRVAILVARRDRLMRLDGRLGAEPLKAWQLEVDPGASTAQRKMLDLWLAQSGNPAVAG